MLPGAGVLLNLLLVHSFNKHVLGTHCVARSCSRHVEKKTIKMTKSLGPQGRDFFNF